MSANCIDLRIPIFGCYTAVSDIHIDLVSACKQHTCLIIVKENMKHSAEEFLGFIFSQQHNQKNIDNRYSLTYLLMWLFCCRLKSIVQINAHFSLQQFNEGVSRFHTINSQILFQIPSKRMNLWKRRIYYAISGNWIKRNIILHFEFIRKSRERTKFQVDMCRQKKQSGKCGSDCHISWVGFPFKRKYRGFGLQEESNSRPWNHLLH